MLLGALALMAGCATVPSTGSSTWHEERMAEIESAYQLGDLTEEAYLSLKNEADQVRVNYQQSLRARQYDSHYYRSPFLYHHHMLHHHH